MKGEKVEKPKEGNVRDILYFDIYSLKKFTCELFNVGFYIFVQTSVKAKDKPMSKDN